MSDEGVVVDTAVLDAAFAVVENAFADRGLVVTRLPPASRPRFLGLQVVSGEATWRFDVDCFEEKFALPRVWLRERQPGQELLAHVSYGGVVCVTDGQGMSLDMERPLDIIAYAALAAYDLFCASAKDAAEEGYAQFLNELEGYWSHLPNQVDGRASFEPDGRSRVVTGYRKNAGADAMWYFIDVGERPPAAFEVEKLQAIKAMYVHLPVVPLPPTSPVSVDATYLSLLRASMSAEQVGAWDKLLAVSKNGKRQAVLLVSTPRPAGGVSLIGIAFGAHRGVVDTKAPITPFVLHRHSVKYMRERGGSSLEAMSKRVVIIGCGSVGSEVASALAASGVGHLELVDPDDYTEENVFRHVLRPTFIGLSKVYSLRAQLKTSFPGLQVTARKITGQNWLREQKAIDADGVVIAIGMPSVERAIARRIRELAPKSAISVTWLDPLDIGGHSVLAWSHEEGCLDCLYRDDEGMPALAPSLSFMESHQKVTRSLTGCFGVFVPFSVLQSRRTGLMAAEQMFNAISGLPGKQYAFWTGQGQAAMDAGLKLTPWWREARRVTADVVSHRVFGSACSRCRKPA